MRIALPRPGCEYQVVESVSHSLSDMHMISILFYADDGRKAWPPHAHPTATPSPGPAPRGWTLYTDTINSQRLEYSYASHAGVARGGIYLAGE